MTNTVADFVAVYTAPDVLADTNFDYQVTITAAGAQSAVAVTTNFRTVIKPRPPGTPIAVGTRPTVRFNPVILSLTANGSEIPGAVELVAAVSDDSAPDHLSYQWSYTPDAGTAAATFASAGQGNPGLLEGYTVADQGTITLAVTDENTGTTTLHYQLTPDQFADAIDHQAVNGLKRIVSGAAHTCVLTGDDRVRCWGDNQYGQLGYGNAIDVGDAPDRLPSTAGDVPLPATDPVLQLVAGNNHTCVLLRSGLVYCWGLNNHGQLGYNRTDNLGDGEPVTAFGYATLGDLAVLIAAGGDHTCAVLKSGALRCWGRNDFGQLGRGNTADVGDTETVYSAGNVDLGAGVTVRDLALGGFHTCALLTTGAVRCWGRNDFGQLGYGSNQALGNDEPIANLPDVSLTGAIRKIVAGDLHTCALTEAGTLRCWGRGDSGQLGQPFTGADIAWGNVAGELPTTLASDINLGGPVTDIVAGANHTCALTSAGLLKCWGLGTSGQLGYSSFSNLAAPPAAGVNLDGVTAYRLSAGAAHTCALRSNGTARCWGAGGDGRLGRGNTSASASASGNVDIQIFPLAPGQLPANLILGSTGAPLTLVVPVGVHAISVKAWGAGGGGGAAGRGGGGGFSSSPAIAVTPGDILTIVVGQGGRASAVAAAFGGGGFRNPAPGCNLGPLPPPFSGGGGGYSGVFLGAVTQGHALVVAGGGGGGGSGTNGGAGGGDIGGISEFTDARGGGGSQVAGGSGGIGVASGLAGAALLGGNGDCGGQGGAGGGGYFGGGGSGAVNGPDAGGAGGSGHAPGGTSVAGAGSTPAMTSDADYEPGLAVGGAESVNGGDGRIVLMFH